MKSPQRGFTLVELLAVLAVFSVTLGTAVMTLHALLLSGARARDSMDASIQLTRFAAQLRTDTHTAVAITAVPTENAGGNPVVLHVQLPKEQLVEYRLHADGIQRVVRSGTSDVRLEFYRLRPLVERGWQIAPVGSSTVASVCLRPLCNGGRRDDHALPPLRVDAAVRMITHTLSTSPPRVSP
jgi:prepilin-type N-terminal cleavage/methylation domain-containing protein